MDLLGDYGDDDSEVEEEEKPAEGNDGAGAAAQPQALTNLVGYLQAGDDEQPESKTDESKTVKSNRPVASAEPSPSPTLSSKGLSGSWIKDGRDSTPTLKPRNAAIRIISKSTTPVASSPAAPVDVPSDVSCPASPHINLDASAAMPAGSSISSLPEVTLPAAPEGEVDPRIAANVAKFAHLRVHKGARVNADLYDKKEFHNPGILEFLVNTYNIKETGSNYPKELFDPESYTAIKPSLFYDHLRRQADQAETRRQNEIKAGTARIEFVGGTAQVGGVGAMAAGGVSGGLGAAGAARPLVQHVTVPAAGQAAVAAAAAGGARAGADGAEKPRKRSKWDQAVKPVGAVPLPGAASTGIAINDFKRLQQMGQ